MNETLMQGVSVMLIGMGTVVAFLCITIISMFVMSFVVGKLNKLFPEYINESLKEAIEYFERAIEKEYVYAYNNLGGIEEKKGNIDKAYEYYFTSADLGESWACNKVGEEISKLKSMPLLRTILLSAFESERCVI